MEPLQTLVLCGLIAIAIVVSKILVTVVTTLSRVKIYYEPI